MFARSSSSASASSVEFWIASLSATTGPVTRDGWSQATYHQRSSCRCKLTLSQTEQHGQNTSVVMHYGAGFEELLDVSLCDHYNARQLTLLNVNSVFASRAA